MTKPNLILILILASLFSNSQVKTPAVGGNKKASVSEQIGITDITINYDRPAVKGREGKIWGNLVHYGFADLHYGTSKAAPWRAGANENTTFEFTTDVSIEGKPLSAGKYPIPKGCRLNCSLMKSRKQHLRWDCHPRC